MKTGISFIIAFFLVAGLATAQDLKLPSSKDVQKTTNEVAKQTTPQANLGSLIGQLTNNLLDKSFTSEFKAKKESFTKSLSSTSDASGLSKALQTLQGGLAHTAMDATWSSVKTKWIKDAKTANAIQSVASLTKILESHINQSAFKGSWAQARPVWQSALATLAK